jgi:hypothetical protein
MFNYLAKIALCCLQYTLNPKSLSFLFSVGFSGAGITDITTSGTSDAFTNSKFFPYLI